MPFSGVEWTFQARDLGYMQEIESDEEAKDTLNQTKPVEELEMSELQHTTRANRVNKYQDPCNELSMDDGSLDSIMED
jgi:hypothetical protein